MSIEHNHNYEKIILNNKEWVKEKLALNSSYFEKLSRGQKPSFLYIGCSDSRMPITKIAKLEPGEFFIHRNIANLIYLTDMNFLSVLEYSVELLKVKHIIVCGHYQCGGVTAAVSGFKDGIVGNWIMSVRDLYLQNKESLDSISDMTEKCDKLSELNTIAQIKNLCKTSVMKRAFEKKEYPKIHGWVIDIYQGLIKELQIPFEDWKAQNLISQNVDL